MTKSARCPSRCPRFPHVPGRQPAGSSTPPPPSARWSTSPSELFTEHGYAATSLDAIVAGRRRHQGRALPPLQRQAGAVRGGLRAGRGRRGAHDHPGALDGHQDPWEKALAGLRAFLAVVQEPSYRRIVIQDGPSVLGLRALPRAGGALDVRQRARHRALGAERRRLGARRRDGAHLRPDLLRRDVLGRRQRLDAPTTPTPRPSGSRSRSGSSWPASARWPTRASELPTARRPALLREGDVPAVDRHQLDPGVAGRHLQLAALRWSA